MKEILSGKRIGIILLTIIIFIFGSGSLRVNAENTEYMTYQERTANYEQDAEGLAAAANADAEARQSQDPIKEMIVYSIGFILIFFAVAGTIYIIIKRLVNHRKKK